MKKLSCVISLAFLIIIILSSKGSYAYTWDAETVYTPTQGIYVSLAYDLQWRPAIAHGGYNENVSYSIKIDSLWEATLVHTRPGDNKLHFPDLDFDNNGNPGMVVSTQHDYLGTSSVTYWHYDPVQEQWGVGAGWGSYARGAALTYKTNGNPAITTTEVFNGLRYRTIENDQWKNYGVTSSSGYPDIVMHSLNNPGIAYTSPYSVLRYATNLRYVVDVGWVWDYYIIENDPLYTFFDPSLAVSSCGYVGVAYARRQGSGGADLMYGYMSGSVWITMVVDSPGDVGHDPSLAFDNQCLPAISYRDVTNGTIKYAHFNGSSWDIETVTNGGGDTSLAFDQNGLPTIAYFSGGVKFAWVSDADEDGVLNDGDASGTVGDNPCSGGTTENCDDNCIDIANPNQEDEDDDGVGTVCDNCTDDYNPDQQDLDEDGSGDACDECTDTDEDGYGNPGFPINTCSLDNCPENYNPNQEDFEGDGEGDVCDLDDDNDGIPDDVDICPLDPENDIDGDTFCANLDNCPDISNPEQEDSYPPQGNDIGDACDCECDFSCDGDVDAEDITTFLIDFGRSQYSNPCESGNLCTGDLDCDGDVDGEEVTKLLEDFGRGQYSNPCPQCAGEAWCSYQ